MHVVNWIKSQYKSCHKHCSAHLTEIIKYSDLTKQWTDDAAVPRVILNCHCFNMTVLKHGCLILLNACCLDSSHLMSLPRLPSSSARKAVEDVQTEKCEEATVRLPVTLYSHISSSSCLFQGILLPSTRCPQTFQSLQPLPSPMQSPHSSHLSSPPISPPVPHFLISHSCIYISTAPLFLCQIVIVSWKLLIRDILLDFMPLLISLNCIGLTLIRWTQTWLPINDSVTVSLLDVHTSKCLLSSPQQLFVSIK